jgi:tRNA dimethylallyltransferase
VVDEVRALLAKNYAPDLPVMRAHGVPELAAYLRGEWDEAAAVARAQQVTRNYAKRQYTWFTHQLKEKYPDKVTIINDFGASLAAWDAVIGGTHA